MKQYRLSIVVEQDANGFFVSCPQLQGCYTQGKTYEEALKNIRDAIKLHLADRRQDREAINTPASISLSTVEVTV